MLRKDTVDRLFLLGLLCIQDEVSESGQASVGHGSKVVLLRESLKALVLGTQARLAGLLTSSKLAGRMA